MSAEHTGADYYVISSFIKAVATGDGSHVLTAYSCNPYGQSLL